LTASSDNSAAVLVPISGSFLSTSAGAVMIWQPIRLAQGRPRHCPARSSGGLSSAIPRVRANLAGCKLKETGTCRNWIPFEPCASSR
jgi:hypothetical protein